MVMICLSGDVYSANSDIRFNVDTELNQNVVIDSGSGSGDVVFNGRLDGNYNLVIESGTGDVGFNQTVGNQNRLNQLTVQLEIPTSQAVKLNSHLNVDTGTLGIKKRIEANNGGVTITNTGLAEVNNRIQTKSNIGFDGSGDIQLRSNLQTTEGQVNVSESTLRLMSDSQITTNGGQVNVASVQANTADSFDLTINSGSGNVTFNGVVGDTKHS